MKSNSVWNRLHGVIEVLILIGFVIGLIPFLYGWAATWVIPLTVISAGLAFLLGNGVLLLTVANIMMSVLSIIPLIGYAPRIIGILITLINIAILSRQSRY